MKNNKGHYRIKKEYDTREVWVEIEQTGVPDYDKLDEISEDESFDGSFRTLSVGFTNEEINEIMKKRNKKII